MSPSAFGLRALIRPLSRARFERRHWLQRPLLSHGALSRFGVLSRIPELQDARRLCEATRGPVTVFARDGRHRDLDSGLAALPFYEEDGETLYFRRLGESIPALADLAARLAEDLGVWPEDVAVEAFASRDGAGTAMHFDSEQNFNIQLRGRKTWRLLENRAVSDPLQSFVAGQEPPFELASYAAARFPKRLPASAARLTLRPGSSLYVPRGHWHQTAVSGDSLAVCFAVKPPVWAALALDALRLALIRDPRWRQAAFGLAGGAASRAALRRRLAELLPSLAQAAAALDAKSIVPEPAAGGPSYRWARGRRELQPREEDSALLSVRPRGGKPLLVEVDEELLPLLRWALRQTGPFQAPHDDPAFSALPAGTLDAWFRALARAGALKR